ncbi:MAG: diguanylate cyclase [Mobilitalea sp.]
MEELNKQLDGLLQTTPGGIATLALDDMLSILYATDTFYKLIKSVTDKDVKGLTSLLRMVYSADIINLTQQIASQKQRKDNLISLNFRTLQQDGSFKWIIINGSKTEEAYQPGAKAYPVYSCIAIDITNLMQKYKKLEQSNDYHRIISELSRDLYFEYEIATDTMSFSEHFRELFGKESTVPNFRKRLEKTKIVHDEELPAIISIYNSMMSGRKLARFEVRLIPKDGIPVWYICYASIIFDENKNPVKVVGKFSPMNMVNYETVEIQPEVVLDATTNVCTKDSAVNLIQSFASKQKEDIFSAFLLIDIRNYKGINEVKKIMNGENILTTIGSVLKSQVRTSDIIGRLGVSEFVIYVKELPTDRIVYELAERLCKKVEALHSYTNTKSNLNVSIGIAFHRGAEDYANLLANANTALIMAKKVANSSFEVFSGSMLS